MLFSAWQAIVQAPQPVHFERSTAMAQRVSGYLWPGQMDQSPWGRSVPDFGSASYSDFFVYGMSGRSPRSMTFSPCGIASSTCCPVF